MADASSEDHHKAHPRIVTRKRKTVFVIAREGAPAAAPSAPEAPEEPEDALEETEVETHAATEEIEETESAPTPAPEEPEPEPEPALQFYDQSSLSRQYRLVGEEVA